MNTNGNWLRNIARDGFLLFLIGFVSFGTGAFLKYVYEDSKSITAATSGYAWNDKIGWISLSGVSYDEATRSFSGAGQFLHATTPGEIDFTPQAGESIGVTVSSNVNGSGLFAVEGFAFSEELGWIQFQPGIEGVFANADGEFSGSAWGEEIGWILFSEADIGAGLAFTIIGGLTGVDQVADGSDSGKHYFLPQSPPSNPSAVSITFRDDAEEITQNLGKIKKMIRSGERDLEVTYDAAHDYVFRQLEEGVDPKVEYYYNHNNEAVFLRYVPGKLSQEKFPRKTKRLGYRGSSRPNTKGQRYVSQKHGSYSEQRDRVQAIVKAESVKTSASQWLTSAERSKENVLTHLKASLSERSASQKVRARLNRKSYSAAESHKNSRAKREATTERYKKIRPQRRANVPEYVTETILAEKEKTLHFIHNGQSINLQKVVR